MKRWIPYLTVLVLGIVGSLIASFVFDWWHRTPPLPPPKEEWITVNLDDRDNLLQNEGTCTLKYLSKNKDNRLTINIELSGVKVSHSYVLILNGKPGKPGNDILKRFSKTDGEGYYDFGEVKTDSQGNVHGDFIARNLPSGLYEVKFLVKDKSDYKVVLLNDNLYFAIE